MQDETSRCADGLRAGRAGVRGEAAAAALRGEPRYLMRYLPRSTCSSGFWLWVYAQLKAAGVCSCVFVLRARVLPGRPGLFPLLRRIKKHQTTKGRLKHNISFLYILQVPAVKFKSPPLLSLSLPLLEEHLFFQCLLLPAVQLPAPAPPAARRLQQAATWLARAASPSAINLNSRLLCGSSLHR